MKKTMLLGLGMGLLFSWSCNNPVKSTSTDVAETQTDVHAEHNHHYNESDEPLELNDGERWVVNEEMKPFVTKGSDLVSTYAQGNQEDYEALADQLRDQNNKLIQSCTMTGKSHDELHKWLHPHLVLVENLAQAENHDEATTVVGQLENSYQVYHTFFQ